MRRNRLSSFSSAHISGGIDGKMTWHESAIGNGARASEIRGLFRFSMGSCFYSFVAQKSELRRQTAALGYSRRWKNTSTLFLDVVSPSTHSQSIPFVETPHCKAISEKSKKERRRR